MRDIERESDKCKVEEARKDRGRDDQMERVLRY